MFRPFFYKVIIRSDVVNFSS